jgi:phage-related protein
VTFLWDAIMGVVDFLGSNFVRAAVTEAFEALGAFFVEAAAVVFSPFGALVAAIAAAVAAAGVVLYGFVQQIREDWDQWKEVFGRIGKAIAQIVQNIADTFPILKIIGGAIWSAGKFVIDAFTSVGSTLIDTVKDIGSAVWGFVKTVFDKILTFLSGIGSGLAKNALGIFKSVAGGLESAADATRPAAPAASIAGTPGLNQSLSLQESLLDANKEHSKKLDAQNQLASDSKELLQRMLDHLEGTKPEQGGVKVNIGFDARKWGIASEQAALNEAAAVGR